MTLVRSAAATAILLLAVGCSTPESVTRTACVVPAPVDWAAAIEDGVVDTGGVSTTARAVAPGGDVLAVRDNGDTRDLLLIGTDRRVRELYSVPEPDTYDVGYAGIDDRWIVFALDEIPRNANGVLPTIRRIEVMDRRDGSIRTVVAQSAADRSVIPELNVLDSVALHDGRVYWRTRADYTSDIGTVRSYDPVTGVTTDEPGLTTVPSAEPTDGVASGWIVGVEDGGTGVGYRSPDAGTINVTGLELKIADVVPAVFVYGPFVVLDKGFGPVEHSYAVAVDTRSGAVTGLQRRAGGQYDRVIDARDGVLAMNVWSGPGKGDYRVGVLGRDALAPLEC